MKYKKLIMVFATVIILSFTLAIKIDNWEVLDNPNDDYLKSIRQMEMYLEGDPKKLHLKKNLAFNYLMQQDYIKARTLYYLVFSKF